MAITMRKTEMKKQSSGSFFFNLLSSFRAPSPAPESLPSLSPLVLGPRRAIGFLLERKSCSVCSFEKKRRKKNHQSRSSSFNALFRLTSSSSSRRFFRSSLRSASAIDAAMKNPTISERLKNVAIEPIGGTQASFEEFVTQERGRLQSVVKLTGMTDE